MEKYYKYKIAYGDNPLELKFVYVNAKNHTEAENIVMESMLVPLGLIYETSNVGEVN
jgi:hypothetical protein